MSSESEAKLAVKVLDSWAVLAWLKDQPPAADVVEAIWQEAREGNIRLLINIINLGEVFYIAAKVREIELAELILEELQKLPFEIYPVSNSLVIDAARIKGQYAISYADAFAVVTAQKEGATLVTGDPELKALVGRGIVAIEWIGP